MKKTILIFTFMLYKGLAQQDPQYTQYMYNMNVINPAYATGTPAILNLGSLYRTQWVGVEGAPKTLTLFAHTPATKKVELGFSLVSDDIGSGVKKETHFFADIAYVLKMNEKHNLSFGIKTGFTRFDTNLSRLALGSPTDPDMAFVEDIHRTFGNIGAGIFYFTDHYYLGLSMPNFLPTKHLKDNEAFKAIGTQSGHIFLTGGYVYKLNNDFKLKPSFMAKTTAGAPITVDLGANVLFKERFEGGIAYRLGDSFSALVNVNVTPSIRVGYAYDYTLSHLSQFSSGSHELFLLFDLDFLELGRKYEKSSRFF